MNEQLVTKPAPGAAGAAAPHARYMDSVPLLQTQGFLAGFCWIVEGVNSTPLPPDVTYVCQLPSGGILVVTGAPSAELLPGLRARPWPLQIYNDIEETAPFAILGADGRYAQLESFGLEKQVVETGESIYSCKFLCGQTTGQTHVCAD